MKCPKCHNQNKPGVKKCTTCKATMPIRKKKAPAKTIKKEVIEEKKEPIIEFKEEKKQLENLINKIKKINKIFYLYAFLIILSLSLIVLISVNSNTVTCKLKTSSGDTSYSIKMKIKHKKDSIVGFKYLSNYKSKKNNQDEFKLIYNSIIDSSRQKENFDQIIKADYDNRHLSIVYDFDSDSLNYITDYLGIDVTTYQDDVNSFVKEMEKVGFSCK